MIKNDIQFSPYSVIDDFGRIFFQNGRVFRAINYDKKVECLNFLKSALFEELSTKKLIPKTTIAEFSIEGYGLVLEHEKLLETYQYEWTFNMFKDAALMVVELNNICNKYGYELKDGHPFNILFKGTNPIFVDIGSISFKINREWVAYDEFVQAFMVPLLFWTEGNTYIVRKLVGKYPYKMFTIPERTLIDSNLLKLLKLSPIVNVFRFKNRILFSTNNYIKIIDLLRKVLNLLIRRIFNLKKSIFSYKIKFLPSEKAVKILRNLKSPEIISLWQNYHQYPYENYEEKKVSMRFMKILELIKEKEDQVDSIIDLAGNSGFFCSLLAKETKINKIILTDYDENAINKAYNKFKKDSFLNNINTALLNFMVPEDIIGTPRRFKSDIVLALAVTHHLILTNKYSLSAIFQKIKEYSNRYVFIEFMPLGLWGGEDSITVLPEGYNINWFRKEFIKIFVLEREEILEKNRVLFVGKIIESN